MLQQWQTATVGVSSIERALALWVDLIGFEIISSRRGPENGLAKLWSIPPSSIRSQTLIGHPNSKNGNLLFVEVLEPGSSVRQDAAVFDQCTKNIDILVTDIKSRANQLQSLKYKPRNATPSEIVSEDGTRFKEIHFTIHDEINLVLLELPDKKICSNHEGFGPIGPIISVVPDASIEKRFYSEVLGLQLIKDKFFSGRKIETMIGLPEGAGLGLSVWGKQGQMNALLELVEYSGVTGNNLFSRAALPNCGLHAVSFSTAHASKIVGAARAFGSRSVDRGEMRSLCGNGHYWSVYTPAGMRIDIIDPS